METKHFKGDLKVSPNTTRQNLAAVISFRLTIGAAGAMDEYLISESTLEVRSRNGLARKLVLDVLAGRLAYRNPEDAKVNSIFLDRAEKESPAAAAAK